MISFTTEAIILRSRDIGSYDRVYTVYTKDRGKLFVRAISIRKAESKLQSSMNAHALLNLSIIAQRRFTLGGVVIIERFDYFSETLFLQWLHQHVREMVDLCTKPEFHDEQAFLVALSFLTKLKNCASLEQAVHEAIVLDLHLLAHFGFLPDLSTDSGRKAFFTPGSQRGLNPDQQSTQLIHAYSEPQTPRHLPLTTAVHAYAIVQAFIRTLDIEPLKSDSLLRQLVSSKTLR